MSAPPAGGALRLGVLGDPLRFTLSPELHRAGLRSVGLECDSQALRTPRETLGERLRALRAEGYVGVNLTAPLKEEALAHLDRVTERARRARSVNTVVFERDATSGDTTDGIGFVRWLGALGRAGRLERVVLLGAGGAARSIGFALADEGATLDVIARDPARATAWEALEAARVLGWDAEETLAALAQATLVVNCTPIDDLAGPKPIAAIAERALIVDLRYAPTVTPWVRAARGLGREAYDGLGLLVFQARESLSIWLDREIAIDPLVRAVGWPR